MPNLKKSGVRSDERLENEAVAGRAAECDVKGDTSDITGLTTASG